MLGDIVVVDRHGQIALGSFLALNLLVEKGLDFERIGKGGSLAGHRQDPSTFYWAHPSGVER